MSKEKEYEPDFSNIKGRLTESSWLWFHNKKGELEDFFNVFIELESIDESYIQGDISLISSWINSWKENYPEYDELLVEKVSIHLGCGDYRDDWYLVGKRKESSEEREKRILDYQDRIEKEKKLKNREIKKKKDREYEKFLRLKEKFEPKSEIERTQELNKKLKEMGVSGSFKKGEK